jgi:hypothetical protein
VRGGGGGHVDLGLHKREDAVGAEGEGRGGDGSVCLGCVRLE